MQSDRTARTAGRFGTFAGVFTPCTLTILGVIMFLRFGYCVAQAGMTHALGIVLLSKAITLLTALSLSAISTNIRVGGGGAYFLISRSLGVEFGSAIGIVFFLAQAVSVAMYVIGFSEALLGAFPGIDLSLREVATIANVVVFISVFIGAGWTIKVQYGILATLGLSLISFYVGTAPEVSGDMIRNNLTPNYTEGQSFFTIFGVFFPAVTGIMAGANMSGDLKDPGRSIPRGTLSAIGVTALVYISLIFLLGSTQNLENLVGDNLIMKRVAHWPILITAGVLAATASSALGSMMGAPRILQQFGIDNVIPPLRFFGRGSGRTNEPRRAVVLTLLISQFGVMIGDLNAIAPIITMFFLITYGTLNFATFSEAFARNPSYRPRFRFSHWSTALLGAVGCFGVMFLMQPLWAVIALLAMAGIYRLVSRREIGARWGDVQSGGMYERARRNLLKLEDEKYHPKNWRPSILAFTSGAWDQPRLAAFGHWLTGGRGVLSLAQIIVGDADNWLRRRDDQERLLRRFISEQELSAFPVAIVSDSVDDGVRALVQCHGIGGIRPNTALIQWPTGGDVDSAKAIGQTLRTVARLDRSIVALRYEESDNDVWRAPTGPIDVWWSGGANGPLMLLFAHLLSQNAAWRGRPIRLIRVINSEAGREETERHLRELADMARIDADPTVVVAERFAPAIRDTSRTASLVFVGFPPTLDADELYVEQMNTLTEGLTTVAFVRSAGGMELDV